MNQKMKKWLCPLLLGLLLVWTGHMLLREQSPAQLAAALRGANPLLLLAGFGLMLVFVGSEAACTHLILRTLGSPAPYRRCLGYSCIGFYFSTITPSSTGGQPMQVYAMTKDGISGAHGTLDMLLVTICYQVATALYALSALLFFPGLFSGLGTGLTALLVFGFSATSLLTVVMVLFLVRPAWCARLARTLIRLLVRLHLLRDSAPLEARLEVQMAQYAVGGRVLRSRPSLFPRLLGLSLIQLSALYLVPWAVYRALGLSGHSAVEIVALQALMTVAVGLLPLPGAAGASETAFLQAFAAFFGGLVAPATILSRGISCYGMLLITGLVTLLIHLRHKRRGPLELQRVQIHFPYESRPKAA